jgi:hypothetical protein
MSNTTQVNTTPGTPPPTVTTSKKYSLNLTDLSKGLIVAAIAPVVPIIQSSLAAGTFLLPWKAIGIAAASGLVGYLVKNFFTPAQTVVTPPPTSITVSK